ncbi:hypothetical protein MAR_032091 [Mya arenaria]|uniref:Uncharacterized protein n=1 Tax=Mya arenaria TaxID=6604 RepID=A0ABY7F5N7_MYAAR|nr:uncharacterized protein LOC128204073 [Mya arenaria]WAR17497.1 hypothetical protein MAR_032091 [Mya arenaria]
MAISRFLTLTFGSIYCAALVYGCSTNTDCPQDQCCGFRRVDIIGLDGICENYSQEGEGCHGSLLWQSCDCAEGLECVEHTGIFAIAHTSKGSCRRTGAPSVVG